MIKIYKKIKIDKMMLVNTILLSTKYSIAQNNNHNKLKRHINIDS